MVHKPLFVLTCLFFVLTLCCGILAPAAPADQGDNSSNELMIIQLDGSINPGTALYVERGIEEAQETGAALVIIRLDTPGGLASSMRTIVKAILNSPVPVVVYVGPRGAGAASAGVMITVSGHVAAMAKGTNIGAAHPVTAGGKDIDKTMNKKVVNDMASYGRGIAENKGRNGEWVEKAIRESVSITAEEAREKYVVDLVVKDMDDLIQRLHGREVYMADGPITLKTQSLKTTYYRPGFRDRVLKTISDPNIAYILMMIGLAGLYFELSHPGAIFPGVIGAISLILAFFSFQTLPVNYAGLILIALAILFFIAEVKVASYGILSIGGLISLTLGSIMLFEGVGVSLKLMMPTILLVGGFFVVVATLAFRAYQRKPKGGAEGLVGELGVVKEPLSPEGRVFVHGEYWRAVPIPPSEVLKPDEKVEVVGVEGLLLKVKKATDPDIEHPS
ncbi:MAG: nodulation protein NfeD [Deltaproteobacteria bacterium]|nr:nodulation protein NfeD [Deltaproteobacteria bacterium]MCF8119732.1 nodulation protein NfeD [Deltaproteobacteria bacterium]